MSSQNLIQITRMSKSDYYETIAELKLRLKNDLIAPQIAPETLTKTFSENLITPAENIIPDCLTCGLCCFYGLSVPVADDDPTPPENYWEIMLDDAASEIVVSKNLKRTDTKCNYLNGEIGENVACQIYEVRPNTCRVFEAGSDRCHAYRRMFGLEPPLNNEELAEAEKKLSNSAFSEKITFVMITEKETTQRTVVTAEGSFTENKTSLLQITAFLGDDETPHIIHHFKPDEETWLEDDFLALTLAQAKDLILKNNEHKI